MAMAALREASRRLASTTTRNPATARPLLLTHSRGIAYKLFIGGRALASLSGHLHRKNLSQLVELVYIVVVVYKEGKTTVPRFSSKGYFLGLSQFATEDSLAEAFSRYGQVIEATIVTDKVTNRPKGFGFVKFASEEEAHNARDEMNGKVLNGRVIYVDIAKAKPDRAADVLPIARGPPQTIGDN